MEIEKINDKITPKARGSNLPIQIGAQHKSRYWLKLLEYITNH